MPLINLSKILQLIFHLQNLHFLLTQLDSLAFAQSNDHRRLIMFEIALTSFRHIKYSHVINWTLAV